MPKVNVYLPDELAEAVKKANLPLSAICQRALEQSVKRVTAIRAAVLSADPTAELSQFTDRAKTVIKMAVGRAQADGAEYVGTEHLLHAMLDENLSPSKVVASPEWRLFLMRSAEVERELLRLHQFRKLDYQVAGSLVQLSLPCTSTREYAERMVA